MTSEMVERQARFLEEALVRIQGGSRLPWPLPKSCRDWRGLLRRNASNSCCKCRRKH